MRSLANPSILVIDIETAPIEGYVWGLYEQNIGVEQIKTEWSILSYCAKWYEEKKLIYADTSGRGAKKVRDDKLLMKGLWDLLDKADIVVAQNGVSFDVKKINARLIVHGFGPYSPIRVVDTLLASRRYFKFTSNKLAWTGQNVAGIPKSDHKKFPGMELWKECLKDNPIAWREMQKYNKIDVVACEALYTKLRPWISNHPNIATYRDGNIQSCPKCGSKHLQSRGYYMTQAGRYHQYQCQGCGAWPRERYTVLNQETRRKLLA